MADPSPSDRVDLREDLMALLRSSEIRERMSAALLREATEGNRSGSVIRAYALIREIVGQPENASGEPDFSRLTDEDLRAMITRCEETEENGLSG